MHYSLLRRTLKKADSPNASHFLNYHYDFEPVVFVGMYSKPAFSHDAETLKNIFSLGLLYVVGLWVSYHLLNALYNISPLHPRSRFPGPKLAASSYLREIYYDWWLVGRYTQEIKRIHERYGRSFVSSSKKHIVSDWSECSGPIVRINPDELHCNDPYFADQIYAGPGRVRDKWQHHLNNRAEGPLMLTAHSTANHEMHRIRKSSLSKFFLRQQMLKLEDEVRDFAQLTVDKMLRCAGMEPFDVKAAFNCFTADIISQYCFGEPMGFIAQEGWDPNFATWVKPFLGTSFLMRHSSLARKLGRYFPMLAGYMGDDVRLLLDR